MNEREAPKTSEMTLSQALDIIEREARNNRRGSTHYPGCEEYHDYCAALARVDGLRAAVRLGDYLAQGRSYPLYHGDNE